MNAQRFDFAKAARLAVIGAGVMLAGCVSPFGSGAIDPASPVAADVQRLTRTDRPYPKFSDIPAAPKDIRPLAMYGQQAMELAALRDQVVAATEPGTWTLNGAEAFAEQAKRDAPDIPVTDRAEDTEAFARQLQERATPPPPR
jgi:hypothetical protein